MGGQSVKSRLGPIRTKIYPSYSPMIATVAKPDAHDLAGEHVAEVDFASAEADASAAGYADGSM